MTDNNTTPNGKKATDSADYRQVAFVILAALALILTAFVAPPASNLESISSNEAGNIPDSADSPGNPSDPGVSDFPNVSLNPPDISFNWRDLISWFSWLNMNTDVSKSPSPEPRTAVNTCKIYIDRLVPGSRVEVAVWYKGQPLSDAPVWFNDRQIGYTNEGGTVSGRVPYTEVLRVRVGVPGNTKCEFVSENPKISSKQTGLGGAVFGLQANVNELRLNAMVASDELHSNETAKYEVSGAVNITIEGEPYPGETVVIEASIEGVPMRQATVEVDGVPVGRTDDDGRAIIRVPNDGSEQFEVRVSRGDFAGTATVDVLLLDVSLRSEGLAVVPGTTAIVVARLGNQPVEGAVVTINGERRGTTGPNGTLTVELPLDPTATVTVSTGKQTASTSVVAMYRIVVPLLTLVVLALTLAVYRMRGLRSALIVPAAAGAGLAVVIADAVWGSTDRLTSILIISVLVIASTLIRWKKTYRKTMSGNQLVKTTEWIIGAALWIVRKLERAIVRAKPLIERVRLWAYSLPRSITGLLDRFWLWIQSLPALALMIPRRISLVTVATAIVCIAILVTVYAITDLRSAAVVCAVLILALAARQYVGRDNSESTTPPENDLDTTSSTESTTTAAVAEQPSFRELWRAFARRIDPARWRTRTPGEIARDAIDQEYPDEPVYEITTLFCEVEYGGRAYSDTVRDRAEDAYNTIEANPPADTEGEER